jgi:hypothetical protein
MYGRSERIPGVKVRASLNELIDFIGIAGFNGIDNVVVLAIKGSFHST